MFLSAGARRPGSGDQADVVKLKRAAAGGFLNDDMFVASDQLAAA
jgi:hypothetical protein